MSLINPAGKISIPDAPDISPVDLIDQVVNNMIAQVTLLDIELASAQTSTKDASVTGLAMSIRSILDQAKRASSVIAAVNEDDESKTALIENLEPASDTNRKLRKLVESIRELEGR
jgi:type I site-specific restriction endonuclease